MTIIEGTIVVGVEWTLYETLDKANRAIGKQKKILIARKIVSGECVQAVCPSNEVKAGNRAGALLVATAASDALVFQTIGDGSAWVCAVRDGLPLHGFDVVTDESNARALLAEAMSYVPAASIWGDITGAKGTLRELLDKVPSPAAKKTVFRPLSSPKTVSILIVLILLAGVCAFYVIRAIDSRSEANNSAIRASLEALRITEAAKRADLARHQEFEDAVRKAKASFWAGKSPIEQFHVWRDILLALPLSQDGWRPNSAVCDESACTVVWNRSSKALRSSSAKLPGEPDGNKDVMRDQVSTRFKLSDIEVKSYTSGDGWVQIYLADIGVLGTPPVISTSVVPTSRSITVSPPAGLKNVSPVKIGDEGSWKVQSKYPFALDQVLTVMERPGVIAKTLTVSNLAINRNGTSVDYVIEGVYRADVK